MLQQVDAPQEMYESPANVFVAGFIGSPAMNMVPAELRRDEPAAPSSSRTSACGCRRRRSRSGRALAGYAGKPVILGIRPEDIEDPDHAVTRFEDADLPVVVDVREAMGSEVYVHFTVASPPVVTDDTVDLAADAEALDDVEQAIAERTTAFVARLNPRTSAQRGAPIRLQVDTRRLHFFDPGTGDAISGD